MPCATAMRLIMRPRTKLDRLNMAMRATLADPNNAVKGLPRPKSSRCVLARRKTMK